MTVADLALVAALGIMAVAVLWIARRAGVSLASVREVYEYIKGERKK